MDAFVCWSDDAGHEAVLIFVPCGVSLEPSHLLGHHLDFGRCAVEHTLTDGYLIRLDGVDVVVAIGDEVEQVEVGEVLTVLETRVHQGNLQTRVAGTVGTRSLQIGEVHYAQVLVALERLGGHSIQLVIVPDTNVVTQFQGTLVFVEEAVVSPCHYGVLYLVAAHLVHLLRGTVLVGVGVVAAILLILSLGQCLFIGKESLQRFPRLVVEEVLFALGVDDDMELRRVESGKYAVATEDEALRTEGLLTVILSLYAQVEALQVGAAHEG